MPMTWNEKSERDLMVAMLMSMSGSTPGNLSTAWATVATNMGHMGYDTSAGAISQRWSKNIIRSLKTQYPNIFNDNATSSTTPAATNTAAATDTAAVAGKKRGRGRPPKVRKIEDLDLADAANDGDIDSEPHKPAKKAKIEGQEQDDNDEGAV